MKQIKRIIALLLALCLAVALCACGGKEKQDVIGKYVCIGSTGYGDSYDSDGEWIELKKGGKGTFCMGFEFDIKWKLDGENFESSVTFLGIDESLNGTLKDGVLTVQYGDFSYTFLKEGAQMPIGTDEPVAGTSEPSQDALDLDALRGDSMLDYLSALGSGFAPMVADGGFVSPTKSIELGSVWYGTVRLETADGDKDDDIFALINQNAAGNCYFEVFTNSDFTEEGLICSMWIDLYDDSFVADIGDKDAWIYEHYLTADEAFYFSPVLDNGLLHFFYPYTEDGEDMTVQIYLREDGMPWDEENDLLPPHYVEYKAAIEAAADDSEMEAQPLSDDYGLSVPSATGYVDLKMLKAGLNWIRNERKSGSKTPYVEIRELFSGVDGVKYEMAWDDEMHSYLWQTSDEKEFCLVTFKVQEDGSELYTSVSWSSGLTE